MAYYIGIDLGGTHIRAALVNEDFRILEMMRQKTAHSDTVKPLLSQIAYMTETVCSGREISGIGIGVPGVVGKDGVLRHISNIPEAEGVMLAQSLGQQMKVPVSILNDCNAAGLAEARLGAGKGYDSVYYVTISTGIGGSYIYRGEAVEGACGFAGEIGSILVRDTRDGQGFRKLAAGAVEGLAGGAALTERGSRLCGSALHNAGEIFEAAQRGEGWAVTLKDEMTYYLAMMFADISYTVNPEIFVLGGGCMKNADQFMKDVKRYYAQLTAPGLHNTIFRETVLEEAGLLGAALRLRDQMK